MACTSKNNSAKGTRIELLAIKHLEASGYTVHRCIRHVVRKGPFFLSISNDVFGCIDLVAKKAGERTRWIQVTAGSAMGQKKADLAAVPWEQAHDCVEIWRWVPAGKKLDGRTGRERPRKYFQVYRLDNGFLLDESSRISPTTDISGCSTDAVSPSSALAASEPPDGSRHLPSAPSG